VYIFLADNLLAMRYITTTLTVPFTVTCKCSKHQILASVSLNFIKEYNTKREAHQFLEICFNNILPY